MDIKLKELSQTKLLKLIRPFLLCKKKVAKITNAELKGKSKAKASKKNKNAGISTSPTPDASSSTTHATLTTPPDINKYRNTDFWDRRGTGPVLPTTTVKALESFICTVNVEDHTRWEFLRKNEELLTQEVSDALAYTYLNTREELLRAHPISQLFFQALNTQSAAKNDGAYNMEELLKSKSSASFKQLHRAKDRYLDNDYAKSSPVIMDYFNGGERGKARMQKLKIALFCIVCVFCYQMYCNFMRSKPMASDSYYGSSDPSADIFAEDDEYDIHTEL